MRILKISRELIEIAEYLQSKGVPTDGNLYDFNQLWGSTALGFGGMGGQMMTTARTYVFIPRNIEQAYVFFGGTFAYATKYGSKLNDRFWEDVKNCQMASVAESGRYSK